MERELIVVDDASNDGVTGDPPSRFAQRYPKNRSRGSATAAIRAKGAAIRTAVEQATGEFLHHPGF